MRGLTCLKSVEYADNSRKKAWTKKTRQFYNHAMESQTQTVTRSTQDIAGLLKSRGVMPTQQRMMIARVLFNRDQHLSADQVMTRVNDGNHHVSKATVYNTLGLFARKGLLREVIVDPTRVFYDSNTSDHHHFYNIDSGELIDIDSASLVVDSLASLPEGTVTDGVDVIIRVRNAT
jgi:Fur family iron response transcriptional regulator